MSLIPKLVDQIDQRIAELEPLVAELERLRRLRAEMVGPQAVRGSAAAARAAAAAADAVKTSAAAAAAAADGDPDEDDSERAVRMVRQRPGISAADLADALGVEIAVMYRELPGLMRAGRVRKQGNGYLPGQS